MQKAKDIGFIILTALPLLCVVLYLALGSLGMFEFPENSRLEGRSYTKAPELRAQDVLEGAFQSEANQFLADKVPVRDEALLGNAALQRADIELANAVFGWDCYPSQFGTDYAVVPSRSAIITIAPSPLQRQLDATKRWVHSVNRVVDSHPDVKFVYEALDDTTTTEANPTREMVSKPWDQDWIRENVLDALDERITVIYDRIESQDELFSLWLSTEHHWKLERAITAYNKVGAVLGWEPVAWENEHVIVDKWYGSSARYGLDLNYSDSLEDIPVDYAGLTSYVNGTEEYRGLKSEIAHGENPELFFGDPPYNVYGDYYGNVEAETIWENTSATNGLTCLFVEQSFGPPLEPYIARNYARTICVSPANEFVEQSFADYIDRYNVDVVVVQFDLNDLWRIEQNSPNWLE